MTDKLLKANGMFHTPASMSELNTWLEGLSCGGERLVGITASGMTWNLATKLINETIEDGAIIVPNVDVVLLREQRNALLYAVGEAENMAGHDGYAKHIQLLDGLVSLLDTMLDIAEDEEVEPPPVSPEAEAAQKQIGFKDWCEENGMAAWGQGTKRPEDLN